MVEVHGARLLRLVLFRHEQEDTEGAPLPHGAFHGQLSTEPADERSRNDLVPSLIGMHSILCEGEGRVRRARAFERLNHRAMHIDDAPALCSRLLQQPL